MGSLMNEKSITREVTDEIARQLFEDLRLQVIQEKNEEIEALRSFKASALITIQSLRDDKKKLQSILTRERELMAEDTDIIKSLIGQLTDVLP